MSTLPSHPASRKTGRPLHAAFFAVLFVLAFAGSSFAQLANVWHIPTNTETGIPATMRDPLSPAASQSVTFYQGVYKGDGRNQTGGTFYYRIDGGTWQSSALTFHSNSGSNQFWKTTVSMPANPGALFE